MSGVVEGFNELDAVEKIKRTCDVVIKVTEVKQNAGSILQKEIGGNKLNRKAFTIMCSQYAIILRAGLSVGRTTHLLADKTTDKPLKKILLKVAEDVDAGRALSDSFADHGAAILPATFVETIRAGEASGTLDKSFDSMYRHYDKQTKMRSKIKNVLTYPTFVLLMAIVVVIVLMAVVVPSFTDIFASYGSELPLMTRMLIGMSEFCRAHGLKLVLALALGILIFKIYGNTEEGRLKLAKLGLKLPVLGNINQLNAASQFANTMATLLGSGLAMNRAISITASVLDNYYIGQEVGKVTGLMEEGRSVGASLRESGCMPDILVDMVAVGETTGEMEQTLSTIAGYYDTELDMAITSALNKLEPAVLVFMAAVAGFIVIAVYVAMFEMYAIM